LLAQVIDDFYPVLSAKELRANVSFEGDLFVLGDPEKLARVFNNLLKNAAAYSYPNSEIDITTQRKDNDIVIVFKNHGDDISEEQLATIFEKFNRLDSARASDTGEAGLGLSIVREIVNLHGGTITAQSNNEMVIFTITLPCSH
jgi:two-component system, OmpR family, sensor histidine kinase VanS